MSVLQSFLSTSAWRNPSDPPLNRSVLRRVRTAIGLRSAERSGSDKAEASGSLDDEQILVQRATAGDTEALQQLFAGNTARLQRIAFAVLRNKEDAEDALQNAFLLAYRKLATFQGQSRFSTWLTRIVINSALMARRKKSVRPESSLDEFLDSSTGHLRHGIVDVRNNPEQVCAETELRAVIEEQIRRLPPRLETAFRIHKLEAFSVAETAAVLGVQPTTLKARIFRARYKLAKSLRLALQKPVLRLENRCGDRSWNEKQACGAKQPISN